jgi:hypothetical protein
VIGVTGIAAVGLFPPWVDIDYRGNPPRKMIAEPLGHHALFNPPVTRYWQNGAVVEDDIVSVDYGRLLLYWAVIGGVTGALALAAKVEHS